MNLLLLSNSTNPGEDYLGWAKEHINEFCGDKKKIAFVPFAGVTVTWEDYEAAVQKALDPFNFEVISIHHSDDPKQALRDADIIAVGGGNTFRLLKELQKQELDVVIKEEVDKGKHYIGWSAGSNMACPTIKTSNDMPITQPLAFKALELIPFQINPHFTNETIEGHGGESREQRLKEFMILNKDMYIVGLRESSYLLRTGNNLQLGGNRPMRLFRHNEEPKEFNVGDDLTFLLG